MKNNGVIGSTTTIDMQTDLTVLSLPRVNGDELAPHGRLALTTMIRGPAGNKSLAWQIQGLRNDSALNPFN